MLWVHMLGEVEKIILQLQPNTFLICSTVHVYGLLTTSPVSIK